MYHILGSQSQIIIIFLFSAVLMTPLLMEFFIPSSLTSIMAEIITTIPSQDNGTTITTSPFLTYKNPTSRIRIQYPSDWEKLEFNQRNVVVIFRSPPENSSDTKLENLLIQVGNLPSQNITLDEIASANINALNQSLIDFELIELNATTLSGNNPAHKVVYTNREGKDERKTMQVLSIKEDKVYLITYTAEASRYDRYLPTIQKMIDSFRTGDSGIIEV
jgi:serine/threonine-protein kinase